MAHKFKQRRFGGRMDIGTVPQAIDEVAGLVSWSNDWVWGVPTVVGTLMIHAVGVHLIFARFVMPLAPSVHRKHLPAAFVLGGAVVLMTALIGFAATVWGLLYLYVGALPSRAAAMLYSLNALTSFGHTSIELAPRWQMLGAIEALNGLMLAGLTTAYLFQIMQALWWPEKPPAFRPPGDL